MAFWKQECRQIWGEKTELRAKRQHQAPGSCAPKNILLMTMQWDGNPVSDSAVGEYKNRQKVQWRAEALVQKMRIQSSWRITYMGVL